MTTNAPGFVGLSRCRELLVAPSEYRNIADRRGAARTEVLDAGHGHATRLSPPRPSSPPLFACLHALNLKAETVGHILARRSTHPSRQSVLPSRSSQWLSFELNPTPFLGLRSPRGPGPVSAKTLASRDLRGTELPLAASSTPAQLQVAHSHSLGSGGSLTPKSPPFPIILAKDTGTPSSSFRR